jgi:ketosteroid isomerase-like protein
MLTKHACLLALVFTLGGASQIQADDAADREKLLESLMKKEKESWEWTQKRDVAALKDFFADDAVLIFTDGARFDKASFLKFLADFTVESYTIEGKADLLLLTPDAATILYKLTYTSNAKGEKPRKVTVRASSSYARRGGKWVNVFYQETPVK